MAARVPAQPAGRPTLSVVVPVFNEVEWIGRSIEAVLSAARRASWPVEVIVVDDGSTDGTHDRLKALAAEHSVVVITQANQGRFAARRVGVERSSGERVLLLDSRVLVRDDVLSWLGAQIDEHPERRVWNGHVHVDTRQNHYGGFWSGLTAVAWRSYFSHPRLTSFGIDDFDRYPKGTGFFCAPRALLLDGIAAFRSLYADPRLASDDTRLIRWLADRERIWLSPDFACDYHGRSSLGGFVRQAYFRGGTFVDGYLGAAGPTRRAAVVALGAGGGFAHLARRNPRAALATASAVSASAGLAALRCGATPSEARSVAALLPVFAPAFTAGAARGLVLAGVEQRRRGRFS